MRPMKHAYLILAHNEFDVLSWLVKALDDRSNDIYIHYDVRVRKKPELGCNYSKLTVIDNRVKSKWGDVSLAEAELNLMEAAFRNGGYDYYHIISGTHFPIKPLNELNAYFEKTCGKNVLMPMGTSTEEIEMKMGKYHFFLTHLVDKRKWLRKLYHFFWLVCLRLQKRHTRDVSFVSGKASQWCSLTGDTVKQMVNRRREILTNYWRSFCCDEFFVRSFIEQNGLPMVLNESMCFIDFVNTAPRDLTVDDYDTLKCSPALFARKMTGANIELVKKLYSDICK